MSDLSAFVSARLAEDEAAAREAASLSNGGRWWVDGPAAASGKHWIYDTGEKFTDRAVADHIARHDPARVLAEVEAKRQVLATHSRPLMWDPALLAIAAIYAAHPDYREEWKP